MLVHVVSYFYLFSENIAARDREVFEIKLDIKIRMTAFIPIFNKSE